MLASPLRVTTVKYRAPYADHWQERPLIHVDPRFTRTSALADLHVPLRAGSDIVFLGALINHVITNGLYFEEYVRPYTNTQRLTQWHDKAVDPPGDARSEAWFIHHLGRRLGVLDAGDDAPAARQLESLSWDYPTDDHGEPELAAVVKEINGYTVADGRPVPGFASLEADGSTTPSHRMGYTFRSRF